jgi:hypothetical protein
MKLCPLQKKMDGSGHNHVKWNNPGLERQVMHIFSHMQNLDFKNDMNVKGELSLEGN